MLLPHHAAADDAVTGGSVQSKHFHEKNKSIPAASPLYHHSISAWSPQLLLICEACALVATQWSNAYPKGGFRAVVSAV
jgi:hypothetical protein